MSYYDNILFHEILETNKVVKNVPKSRLKYVFDSISDIEKEELIRNLKKVQDMAIVDIQNNYHSEDTEH